MPAADPTTFRESTVRSGYRVRVADRSDLPEIASVLGAAFHDDPLIGFVVPARPVGERAGTVMSIIAGLHLDDETVLVAVDSDSLRIIGVAVWAAPGRWRIPNAAYARHGRRLIRAVGIRGVLRSVRLLRIEKAHTSEPHYYLAILGTHPDHQGRGVGSALMAPFLERADEEEMGAYLESSKESNVAYYARHRFDVRSPLAIPGGPTMHLMWREPSVPDLRHRPSAAGPPTSSASMSSTGATSDSSRSRIGPN